jgi:hypothetical protein
METLRQIRLNCVDIKKAKDCAEKKEYLNLSQHKTLLKEKSDFSLTTYIGDDGN